MEIKIPMAKLVILSLRPLVMESGRRTKDRKKDEDPSAKLFWSKTFACTLSSCSDFDKSKSLKKPILFKLISWFPKFRSKTNGWLHSSKDTKTFCS